MQPSDLPVETPPLTPYSYWQESLKVWSDFHQKSLRFFSQYGREYPLANPSGTTQTAPMQADLLKAVSDLNMQHWQNTARYLETMPDWMRLSKFHNGNFWVDWFDSLYRQSTGHARMPSQMPGHIPAQTSEKSPVKTVFTSSSPGGPPDDLTRIKGIGQKISRRLNRLGIVHFHQIASWSEDQISQIETHLGFKGRVERENWIGQARRLAEAAGQQP